MELIKTDKSWFLSQEGGNYFAALSSLEERTIFIYSYLKLLANESFDKDGSLFKIAFFFADAVLNSDKPYSKFPELLNPETNPFLKYLENAKSFYTKKITYLIFTTILHEKVNPANEKAWIYNSDFLQDKNLIKKLHEMNLEYLSDNPLYMIEPQAYNLNDADKLLQLMLVWIFLK